MTVKIPLRLQGMDLRDTEAYDRIPPDLEELFWTANGGVSLAVVFSDDQGSIAVADAADWADRIAKHMPGVVATEVHDELVSMSDIAARANVAHEAVRLWAAHKRRSSSYPFPAPRQVVGGRSGGKTMSLYAWREVLTWVREVLGIDPDEGIDYLPDAQIAFLNANLATIKEERSAWHPISVINEQIIADVQLLCHQPRVPLASLTTDPESSGSGTSHKRLPVELQ